MAAIQTHTYYLSNATWAHVAEHAVLSRTLSDLRLCLLRPPFEHSAGRFQQVSHLLWFTCTFLGAGLISQWETALSLEHCRGNRHKGKSVYFLLLPWCISLNQSPSMCSPLCGVPEDLLCPVRKGRKALLQCLCFMYLTKISFSWFCSSSFKYPFKKQPAIKIQKPPPESYPGR